MRLKAIEAAGELAGREGAFLSAAPFSLQWSQKSVVLSLDNADARVGRPLTAMSTAFVT
jgi:hypothetical protein